MTAVRGRIVSSGLALVLAGSLAACSNGDAKGNGRTGNAGAGDGQGSAGGPPLLLDAAGLGNVLDAGPTTTPTPTAGGAADPGAAECVGEMQTAQSIPVDMYIMLDRS